MHRRRSGQRGRWAIACLLLCSGALAQDVVVEGYYNGSNDVVTDCAEQADLSQVAGDLAAMVQREIPVFCQAETFE